MNSSWDNGYSKEREQPRFFDMTHFLSQILGCLCLFGVGVLMLLGIPIDTLP